MSHGQASIWSGLPARLIVSFSASARVPTMATRQPSFTSRSAVARPTPLLPPVTTAVRSMTHSRAKRLNHGAHGEHREKKEKRFSHESHEWTRMKHKFSVLIRVHSCSFVATL